MQERLPLGDGVARRRAPLGPVGPGADVTGVGDVAGAREEDITGTDAPSVPPSAPAGLLDTAARARWAAARRGDPAARRLRVDALALGVYGILDVTVRRVHAPRTFRRRDGREGVLRRVTVADATGEVDVVLWGDEVRQTVDGPFLPGRRVRLRGATVKDGWQGGVELHLAGCVVEDQGAAAAVPLEGTLAALGETQVVGTPPHVRFQAEATLETAQGTVRLVLWDDAVRQAVGVGVGARLRVEGAVPHPSLEGWFLSEGAALTPG